MLVAKSQTVKYGEKLGEYLGLALGKDRYKGKILQAWVQFGEDRPILVPYEELTFI